jgi:hypothetical protein
MYAANMGFSAMLADEYVLIVPLVLYGYSFTVLGKN